MIPQAAEWRYVVQSIQNLFRLIVIMGGTTAFILLTIVSSLQYHDILVSNMKEAAVLRGQSEGGRLSAVLNQAAQAAIQISTQAEMGPDIQMNELQQLSARLFDEYPMVFGLGVWLEPYELGPENYYSSFHLYRNSDGEHIVDPYYKSAEYDYFNWDWWIEANQAIGSGLWTEPFYDTASDTYMITASFPISRNGHRAGISTVDISLAAITDYLDEIQPGAQVYTAVIDPRGNYLEDPGTTRGLSPAVRQEVQKLGSRLQETDEPRAYMLSPDDTDYWVVLTPVANTSFVLAMAQPMENINQACVGIITRNTLLYLLGLLILILIQDRLINRYIILPIEESTGTVKKIADGDFAPQELSTYSSPREIAFLFDSVSHMRNKIRFLLDDLQAQTRFLSMQQADMRTLYGELSATHVSLLQVNQELTDSQKRLEMAVRGAGAGLWEWNIPEKTIMVDDHYREILGYQPTKKHLPLTCDSYAPGEFTDHWNILSRNVHPDDWPLVKSMLAEHFKGNSARYTCEYRRRHKDGHWIWLLDSGYVIERDEHGCAKRVVGMIQDISERKTAEEALTKSTSLYQGIVTATENAVVVFDASSYEIVEANISAEILSGYRRNELLNKKCSDFLIGTLDNNERIVRARIVELLKRNVCVIRTSGLRQDGQTIPLKISLTLIPLEKQQLVLAVIYNMSDKIKRQQEREKLERYRAEYEKISGLSVMSAGIVHEISQPANSIKLIADGLLYLENYGQSISLAEALEGLRTISRQCERIEGIVVNLRSLIHSFEEQDSNSSDMNLAVQKALDSQESRIISQNVVIDLSLDPECGPVMGNQIEHELIITNLLSNALDVLRLSGSATPHISIETRALPNGVVLKVADNGPGIPADAVSHIWEPFFSTHKGVAGMGMGMGLPLARSIVTRLKGQIWGRNQEEGGALFAVELPCSQDHKTHEERANAYTIA